MERSRKAIVKDHATKKIGRGRWESISVYSNGTAVRIRTTNNRGGTMQNPGMRVSA